MTTRYLGWTATGRGDTSEHWCRFGIDVRYIPERDVVRVGDWHHLATFAEISTEDWSFRVAVAEERSDIRPGSSDAVLRIAQEVLRETTRLFRYVGIGTDNPRVEKVEP